jgi:hypothetical protein
MDSDPVWLGERQGSAKGIDLPMLIDNEFLVPCPSEGFVSMVNEAWSESSILIRLIGPEILQDSWYIGPRSAILVELIKSKFCESKSY